MHGSQSVHCQPGGETCARRARSLATERSSKLNNFFLLSLLSQRRSKSLPSPLFCLLYRQLRGRMASPEADSFQRRLRPTTHSLTTSFHCQPSPASSHLMKAAPGTLRLRWTSPSASRRTLASRWAKPSSTSSLPTSPCKPDLAI